MVFQQQAEALLAKLSDGAPVLTYTKDWFLADADQAFGICAVYLAFVIFGGLFMKAKKEPINCKSWQFAYNLTQMVICAYMTIEAALQAKRNGYTLAPCNTLNKTSPPMANVLWLFYVSKVLDFADTVFIIFGQKWKQLSFLHVYHHCTIFLIYWMNLRLNYDGDIYLTIVLNGAVHFVMYTYYFVALHTTKSGEKVEIWWKKYLTLFQLIQFLTMNAQALHLLGFLDMVPALGVKTCTKGPSRSVTLLYLVYIQTLFWLFVKFFVSSYLGGSKKGSKKTN